MRVYLDTNIAIYLVENTPEALLVSQALTQIGQYQLCSSYLMLCEALVAPLRNYDQILVAAYERFFRSLERIPTRPSVYRLAARLRAHSQLRTPDALHLAHALYARCSHFLTGDQKLASAWTQIQSAYPSLQLISI